MPAASSAETAARIAASDGCARPIAVTRVISPRRERVTPGDLAALRAGHDERADAPLLARAHLDGHAVPCRQRDRTVMEHLRAGSRRGRSIWSQETAASRRAVGHTRGSVV